MLDRTTFLTKYSEFSDTDSAVVDAALEEAETNVEAWPEKWQNAGHGLWTAHLLADSPLGNSAKLVPRSGGDPSTVYERRFRRLQRIVAAGVRSI